MSDEFQEKYQERGAQSDAQENESAGEIGQFQRALTRRLLAFDLAPVRLSGAGETVGQQVHKTSLPGQHYTANPDKLFVNTSTIHPHWIGFIIQ